MMRPVIEHSEFLIRARAFLDVEAKELGKQRALGTEGLARLRLLARWMRDLACYEAAQSADPLELDEMIEDLESDLDDLRAARDEAEEGEWAAGPCS